MDKAVFNKLFMMSDLEFLVYADMVDNGYDPLDKNDLVKYWSERLD